MNKKRIAGVAILLLTMISILWYASADDNNHVQYKERPYTEFISALDEHKVDLVIHRDGEEEMLYTLFNEETATMTSEELNKYKYSEDEYFRTTWPDYEMFTNKLLMAGVRVHHSKYGLTGIYIGPLLMISISILALSMFISRLSKQKTFGMVKGDTINDGAMVIKDATDDTRFSDIIGHDEILGDIIFISKMIKEPERGQEIGITPPKGVLLSGPPGTGKTMIARAIANEAGVNFMSANASSFIEMYVGVGAKRIRELFKEARQKAPCVLFIDEIDAVGKKRTGRGRNSEDDQAVNALLQEMDGFNALSGVFVIAATNAAESLDEALVRSGRFDRQIAVNPPRTWMVRKELFEHYTKYMAMDESVDLEAISRQTSGFTGADIKSVCNEAGMIALMENKKAIDNDCIEKAIDKKVFKGNRSKKKALEQDRNIIAYHEAGHAVMTYLCGLPIARASIAGTTSGVGGAVFQSDPETVFMTKTSIIDQVKICYAGRASEEIKFEIPTTGASNDITKATQLLHGYVECYGFDKETGLIDMQVLKERAVVPEEQLLARIQDVSKTTYKDTKNLLNENYHLVEVLARELLEKETMTGEEITDLLQAA